MLVFIPENLVLLSVPKTGTTAIEAALRARADIVMSDPPALKHMTLRRYHRFVRPMIEKLCGTVPETVAAMREPLDWLGSWYRYRRRPWLEGQDTSTRAMSFDEFARAYMQDDPPTPARVGRQARMLTPPPDVPGVTHLFRYEDPRGMVPFLEQRLGMRIETARLNVSPDAPLDLAPDTEARVRHVLAEDTRLYDSIPLRG